MENTKQILDIILAVIGIFLGSMMGIALITILVGGAISIIKDLRSNR